MADITWTILARANVSRTDIWTPKVVPRPSGLASSTAVTVVLLSQGSKPLLLGMRVDVGANEETDDVEEWHPSAFGKELLRERKRDWGDNPADLHDGPEAGLDSRLDLVECAGSCDQSHGGQVDAVLDGGDLHKCQLVVLDEESHAGTYSTLR